MTTFTGINPTETQSGKPITESLMTRLANNVLAIQEGDPTAPKIKTEAFEDGELTAIDSGYSTGGSVSFSFDHGEATSQTVYLFATASGVRGSQGNATLSISRNGTVVASVNQYAAAGGTNVSMACGRSVAAVPGSNTFAATGVGTVYLQAMVLKK